MYISKVPTSIFVLFFTWTILVWWIIGELYYNTLLLIGKIDSYEKNLNEKCIQILSPIIGGTTLSVQFWNNYSNSIYWCQIFYTSLYFWCQIFCTSLYFLHSNQAQCHATYMWVSNWFNSPPTLYNFPWTISPLQAINIAKETKIFSI